jgi:hypothetical protein
LDYSDTVDSGGITCCIIRKYMYLQKRELIEIQKFMEAFGKDKVELLEDNCSGIGSTLEAKIHDVEINGEIVTVSKMITDESSW